MTLPPSLSPTLAERLARARADLRAGLPVVLEGPEGPEGPVLAAAAETLPEARLQALRAAGPVAVALTARRAATLKAPAYDGDLARVALPPGAGAAWVRALADPSADLEHPMKGPLSVLRGGDAGPARSALALLKSARLLPAAVLAALPAAGAAAEDLVRLEPGEIGPELARPPALVRVVSARLPMARTGAGRLHVFRPADGGEEHVAVEVGSPSRSTPVLARLHSACFTGDLLGSLRCDCGPQLAAALARMGEEGAGVLLYLDQEGRGIGLTNKLRAYALQDQGFDTVEANHRLGFEDDERDFRIGAAMLKALGFGAVRLMTNNPAKVAMMAAQGIAVTERVPLAAGRGPENAAYLATKAAKSGHLL